MRLVIRVRRGHRALLEKLDLQGLLALQEPLERPVTPEHRARRARRASLERQVIQVRPE